MREKFYALLKEYLVSMRERDLYAEQVRAAPEGIEREEEEVSRKLELTRKHCVALRREIRRYPDIDTLPPAGAPNNPPLRQSGTGKLTATPSL